MTNQEAFEAARAGDWIAESFTRSGDVFTIGGKSTGYSSFADCLTDGQSIFYAAFDDDDNREAGLAIWDASAKTLTPVEIHATLLGGLFTKGDPEPLQFTNGGTITGTFNATGFNTIWRHVFEKGNPHETQADEIDQSNEKLGDTVQEALNKIAAYVVQLDPDGNTDIDWGDLDGLKDLLDSKADQTDLEQEILDRIAGDAALQAQIDAIDPDSDSDIDWSDIENKPTEFPPEPHGHEIDDVNGLQDALDAAGGTPAWDDVTGKPTEFPPEGHTHEQSEVDGLESRLETIEDSITSGGGFVDAPDDGKLYGRQSEAWAEVVIPDGGTDIDIDDLEDSFAENLVLQDRADAQKVVSEFSFEKVGDNPLTMKDTGMYAGAEYVRNKDNVWEVDPSLSVTNDINAGGNLSVEGTAELKGDVTLEGGDLIFNGGGIDGDLTINGNITIEGGGIIDPDGKPIGGGAAGTHIGELPPDAPEQGQFWLDISGEAVMWIYDDGKWLQHPSAGGGGSVMASDVALDNPTRVAPGLNNQSEANIYFADALSKVVTDDGNVIGPDLSDYYTSTEVDDKLGDYYTKSESDSAFQPKGDFIEDAPSDGNLYIRKDGGWEVYVPSSGGGGSYMKPVKQPTTVGNLAYSMRGDGGSKMLRQGSWWENKSANKSRLTVPAGFNFILNNLLANNKNVKYESIVVDGVQMWETGSNMGKEYMTTGYDGYFFPESINMLVEDYVEFETTSSSDVWFHFLGWFVAADGTRESEVLREEYLAAEAERLAAEAALLEQTPVTQEVPDE